MPIRCPHCGTKHDVVEFSAGEESGRYIQCKCGFTLDLSLLESVEDFLRYCEGEEEHKKAREIQRDAEAICAMILDENSPEVDIEIAKERLKRKAEELFPDKLEVYRMIYEARFKRLWDQFRGTFPGSD